jgi:hypothetical protein
VKILPLGDGQKQHKLGMRPTPNLQISYNLIASSVAEECLIISTISKTISQRRNTSRVSTAIVLAIPHARRDRQTEGQANNTQKQQKVTIKASRARNPSGFAKIIKTTTNNK